MKKLIRHSTLLILFIACLPFVAPAQESYQTIEPGITPKRREVYFYEMRAYPFGKIPQNARQNGLLHAESKMKQFSAATQSVNQWRPIGPDNVGGRVRSIAVHPTDGKTLWIGAADGGVWKSTDNGGSWRPVMDNENAISMGALTVDPSNPNILYAGTGEMSSNIDAYNGAGLFKSTDGGETWNVVGLTNVGSFARIVVDPKNSNRIYAGGSKNNGGLYRSDDAGRTWKRLSDFPISDVTINPNNSNEVWIGAWSRGIYRSIDAGETLTQVNTGLGSSINRISVQAAPSNPSILYAAAEEDASGGTSNSRIYKSVDKGITWKRVYNNSQLFAETGNSQGWYDQFLEIKPDDENVVFVGGIGVARTTNGGTNWFYIGGYGGYFHPDQHCFAFDPSNTAHIYLGNDGGMYKNDNYLSTEFESINDGLAITQFYALGIDQSVATTTYGGTQDNGTRRTDGRQISGSDGFYVAVDHENPRYVYGEAYNGNIWKADVVSNSNVSISRDFGDETGDDNAAWSAPLVMDPTTSNVLYAGRTSVFQTVDGAQSWQKVSPKFSGHISAIGISPVNNEIIYAGSDKGMVKISTDGGQSWTDRSYGTGLANRAITDFAPSLVDESTAYIAFSGFYTNHISKTTDKGATWTDIGNGLPDIPVNALAIHPEDEKIIYAGTDIGMFITTDGGSTWANYNQGLPRVAIADLEVYKNGKTLRAATHGRSMYEIDLEKPDLGPMVVAPTGGEVWMGGTGNVISWSGFDGPVKIEYSLDDGKTWTLLAVDVGGNTFRWNVVNVPTINARIRVTAVNESGGTATSRTFTIENFKPGGVVSMGTTLIVPYGICFDGEYLWSTDFLGTTLLKFDPKTLKSVGTLPTNAPLATTDSSMFTDITYVPEKGSFFIHQLRSGGGGWLLEMSKDGHMLNRWQSPCAYPIGLGWMGGENSEQPYLLATDRNGDQNVYLIDPENGAPVLEIPRAEQIPLGPRGATAGRDGETFYQVITDFSGPNNTLVSAYVQSYRLDFPLATDDCKITLQSPITSGTINARGIELDTSDRNFWVTDFNGNIYKIVSCEGKPAVTPEPSSSIPTRAEVAGITLEQNMPNPFSGTTAISFSLSSPRQVLLSVLDMNGKTIATLAQGRLESGHHTIQFDPSGLPSGVYHYILTVDNGATISRTMVHMK